MIKLFVTATDTDAGKTLIASALVKKLATHYKVAAYKPISAGCDLVSGQLINEDAEILTELANCHQPISEVNPIAFEPPIAPHIAAAEQSVNISIEDIIASYENIMQRSPGVLITEGAGGWRLPLGNGCYLSEFAQKTQQDVILVINMKLGCLNHAMLTYEAIKHDQLKCVGWVANCPERMDYQAENIAELKQLIDAPLLGTVNFVNSVDEAANCLDVTPLLN